MPQLRENAVKRRGRGARKYYENESPGKLYTYVSAGNIEIPNSESVEEPVVKQGVGPIVLVALLLVLIWLVF